ncbi:hypothetical protein MXD81_52595 [Microbacteriaceae bacterium K1510]|nr:hypothetical protein [Microbacteriaceae bacterium K1510]
MHEGGYTNHPSDPGGPTNFGITIYDYRAYVKRDATADDVKAMRLDDAKRIYRAKYWHAMRCDALPAGVDYAVFDYGVNSGIGRSGKVLRRVLKLPDNTSVVSDAVIAAACAADAKAVIAAICDERLRFLKSLKTWSVFGKGWGRRVAEVRAAALAMAEGAEAAPPQTLGGGRAVVPTATKAQQGSAGAIAAAGAVATQQAHQDGAPVTIVIAIAGLTVVLAIGVWLFWRWRQRRRQEAPV